MRKKGMQILIYIGLLCIFIGIAYCLGKVGGNHFITGNGFDNFSKKLISLLLIIAAIIFILGNIYFFCEEKIKILTVGLRRNYTKKIVICSIVIIAALGSGYLVMNKVKENAVYEQSTLEFDRAIENLEIADNMITRAYEEKNEEELVYRIKWFEDAIEKFRTEDLVIAQKIKKENIYHVKLQNYSRFLIQHKMNFEKLTGNKYQVPV